MAYQRRFMVKWYGSDGANHLGSAATLSHAVKLAAIAAPLGTQRVKITQGRVILRDCSLETIRAESA